jgi:hypothetical protein
VRLVETCFLHLSGHSFKQPFIGMMKDLLLQLANGVPLQIEYSWIEQEYPYQWCQHYMYNHIENNGNHCLRTIGSIDLLLPRTRFSMSFVKYITSW